MTAPDGCKVYLDLHTTTGLSGTSKASAAQTAPVRKCVKTSCTMSSHQTGTNFACHSDQCCFDSTGFDALQHCLQWLFDADTNQLIAHEGQDAV